MTRSLRSARFLLAALAPLLLSPACAKQDADNSRDDVADFRDGVPSREAAEIKVPGAADGQTGALTVEGDFGQAQSALMGQRAEFYTLTRGVTAVVNTGTVSVLVLVRTIVAFPPTSVGGDTAVWGPYTDPLSPNSWRLTVTRVEVDKFTYKLDARAKSGTDADFITILSGTHTRSVDAQGVAMEGFGSGTFTLDWDAAQALPEHDKNVGKAAFTYARPRPGEGVSIAIDFKGVKDDKTGELHDAVYKYSETPASGGDFQYAAVQDVVPDPGNSGTAKETVTIHSRWKQDGAGRGDARTSGGDLGALAPTVNECWDSNFASTFRLNSLAPTAPLFSWGVETTCAFSPAEYVTL